MALLTLGTSANNILNAIQFASSGAGILPADFASIVNGIKNDKIDAAGAHPRVPEALSYSGILTIPNRGYLQVLPGDFVAFDSDGWPILISGSSIGYGSTDWVHS